MPHLLPGLRPHLRCGGRGKDGLCLSNTRETSADANTCRAAQRSRQSSDRSQRSRAARDIPCRAGFNHDAVRDIPCHMGYDYAPPCGGRGIRRRAGYGSDAVRDILFLAAEAVELELLAVRQHVRVEELLEPMPQRHARLHARCRMRMRATSHADITAALGLSAAQPMAVPQWRICCAVVDSHAVARVLWSIRAGGPLSSPLRCCCSLPSELLTSGEYCASTARHCCRTAV